MKKIINATSAIKIPRISPALVTINLLETIHGLFEMSDHLQFIDRPHLFTLDGWRHTIHQEFAEAGTRAEVQHGLRALAAIGCIDVDDRGPFPDKFLLRLYADNVAEIMEALEKTEDRPARKPARRHTDLNH
jgi:hypothetical protein